MGAYWQTRIARDADGKLHFAYVRYRSDEDAVSGRIGIENSGDSMEDMVRLADELKRACQKPIVGLDGRDEGDTDEQDEHVPDYAEEARDRHELWLELEREETERGSGP